VPAKQGVWHDVGLQASLRGGTADTTAPQRVFTLDDLEGQLGASLNKINNIWAQHFVHTRDPRPQRSWCLSNQLSIPARLSHAVPDNDPVICAELTLGPDTTGLVGYTGAMCDFATLSAFQ